MTDAMTRRCSGAATVLATKTHSGRAIAVSHLSLNATASQKQP